MMHHHWSGTPYMPVFSLSPVLWWCMKQERQFPSKCLFTSGSRPSAHRFLVIICHLESSQKAIWSDRDPQVIGRAESSSEALAGPGAGDHVNQADLLEDLRADEPMEPNKTFRVRCR